MSTVEPALTPEEWAEALSSWLRDLWLGASNSAANHRVAAIFLHGQPYGFTWADVDALRTIDDAADFCDVGPIGEGWSSDKMRQARATMNDLADRIAALLPPREAAP